MKSATEIINEAQRQIGMSKTHSLMYGAVFTDPDSWYLYKPKKEGGKRMPKDYSMVGEYPEEVDIKKVDNGFIVIIGCKTLVAKTWKEVSDGLDLYWKDPEKAEKKYCK